MTESSPITESKEISWAPPERIAGLSPRRFRLILAAFFITGLCLAYYFLVMSPLHKPHLRMIGLTSPGEYFNSSWSVRRENSDLYVDQSLGAMLDFSRELSRIRDEVDSTDSQLLNIANQNDWSNLTDSLLDLASEKSDILVLFVSAQGVVRNGQAELHWSSNPDETNEPYVAIEDLLNAVKRHPAKTKLILLDAGWTTWSPQTGILVNDFPRELEIRVHAINDPSLWVFCSHSVGRESTFHHPHQRSLFLETLLYGMRGSADIDGDHLIDLRELMHFTTTMVNEFSLQIAGLESEQHPFLSWGGGTVRIQQHWPVLIPVPTEEEIKNASPAGSGSPETASMNRNSWIPKLITNSWNVRPRVVSNNSAYAGPLAFFWWQASAESTNSTENATSNPASTGPAVPESASASEPQAQAQQAEKTEEELTLAQEVLAVWTKRDALLDTQGLCCSPLEFAPLKLVRLERELIRLDFLARSVSDIKRPAFERQLKRIDSELDALSEEAHSGQKLSHALTQVERADLATRVHSVAMRVQIGTGNDPETTRLTQLSAQLLAAADTGDWSAFRSAASSLSESDRQLEELGWAERLATLDQSISSDLKLRSYQVRSASAELVASAWQAYPWIQADLQTADGMRLAAERTLIDGLISGTAVEVRNLLDRAASEYLRLQEKVSILNHAASSLELTTTRLPAYIEWARLVSLESRGPAPRLEELLRLADLCREVRQFLQEPNTDDFPQLAKAADELERQWNSLSRRTRLDALSEFISMPHLPGEPRQWEALLRTPLLNSDERAMLWSLIDEREFDFSTVTIPPLKTELGLKPRPFSKAEQHALETHLELQCKLLDLPHHFEVKQVQKESDPNAGQPTSPKLADLADRARTDAFFEAQTAWFDSIRTESRKLQSRWAGVVSSLRTELPREPAQLTSHDSMSNLLGWELKARMLDPALYGRRPPVDPTPLRLSASLRDFLKWNAERLQEFSPELPSELAAVRQTWENGYRSALVRFWPRSDVDITQPKTLRLTEGGELDFQLSGETTWTAQCRNLTDQPQKIWLVLDYDKDQLQLIKPDDDPDGKIYSLDELRRDRNLDRLADRLQQQTESFTLAKPTPENPSHPIELKFRIRKISGKPSAVVLYAVSAQGDASVKLLPRLPFSELWNIESVAGTQTFEERGGGDVLLPYPNRTTPYQFQLQYRGTRDRKLEVELFDLHDPLSSPSTVRFDDNPNLLAKLSPLTISQASPNLDLKFPIAGLPETGISVRGPFAFRVTDLDSSETHWIPLFIETQRPRRYIDVTAAYEVNFVNEVLDGTLNVHLEAINIQTLPAGPIPVVCDVAVLKDPASAVPFESVKLVGELSRKKPQLDLFTAIPPKVGRVVSLKVHVDNFPRAFLFEIPCDASHEKVRELAGRAATTIIQPEVDQPFSADVPQIDVKLQVDAPVGAFPDLSRTNRVQLRIAPLETEQSEDDTTKDVAEQEPWVELNSDRQTDLFLSGTEEGILQLRTAVSDWSVRLPTSGLRDQRVMIQSQLKPPNGNEEGQPVTVLIDGLAPKIFSADVPPVVIGEPLEIFLEVDNQDLSGVASVEGYLDRKRTGRFPAPVPPKPDAKEGDQPPADLPVSGSLLENGYWLIQIPSGAVRAGRHQILVRATDRAGNTSRVVKLSARLMTAEEAAGPQGQRDVWGVVQFGDKPIPEAEVTLVSAAPPNPSAAAQEEAPNSFDAKSDEQGRFVFENVPFGAWTLTVKAQIAGRLRIDQRLIEVAPPPIASRIQRVKMR